MPNWLELLVLAVASMFWPTLIVVVVLALQAEQPVKLLVWFLAGGLLTTIVCGIALVFALQGSSLFSGSAPSVDPAVNISMGVLSLLAAYLLNRRGRKPPAQPAGATPPENPKKTPLTQRVTEKGARSAFGAGVVLNIVPGRFPSSR